jgi:outer membrane protein assembly factor BamB
VISGNKLFVGSWDTFLYALDVHSGDLIWKFKTGDKMGMSGIQASPVVDNGMVYFGARDAHFYALDVNTGDVKWKIFADNAWILSSAALQDGMVYFGTSDSYLVLALDAFTGKEKWRAPLNGYVFSSPLLYGDHLFVGDYTGSLYALSLKDGSVISQFATASKTKFADTILNHGKLDFMMLAAGKDASQYSSVVYVMDELYKLGPIVSSPVVRDKTVYVGSADGNVYSIPLRFGNF